MLKGLVLDRHGENRLENDIKVHFFKNVILYFLTSMIKFMRNYCLLGLNLRKNFMLNKNGYWIGFL